MDATMLDDGTQVRDATFQRALDNKVCDFCGNAFNRREHLIRHRRTRKSAPNTRCYPTSKALLSRYERETVSL
jgi:uncharacterized Zn-finger protein